MIDKILRELFSMKGMAVGMLIFAFGIGYATFIESDYGTPASKIAVYDAKWFEILLLYLSITLIVNIVNFKMYQRSKWPTFVFHLSFLLMIVGAAITRYIGFEGQMRIGIGETTNIIYSSTPYFSFKSNDLVNQYTLEEKRWLSEGIENPFEFNYQLPNQKKVKVEYLSYKEHMIDSLMEDKENGKTALELVIRGESKYLFSGQQTVFGGKNFLFAQDDTANEEVIVREMDGGFYLYAQEPYQIVDMSSLTVEDRMAGNINPEFITNVPADTLMPFYSGYLYNIGNESFVLRGIKKNVKLEKMKSPDKDGGSSYLTIKLSTDEESKIVEIDGSHNHIIQHEYFQFAGQNFEVGYGAIPIQIPFSLKCRDFQLDKYPGSDMPSSYASEVTVVDSTNGVFLDQRIFMNNFMDYGGFRFFQSSYFSDLQGTVLSVNYDVPGTITTYIAYFLMGLGMMWAVFNPKGRIYELNNLVRKSRENRMKMLKSLAIIIGLSLSGSLFAQEIDSNSLMERPLSVTYVDTLDSGEQLSAVVEEDHHHHHEDDHHHLDDDNFRIDVNYLSEEEANILDDMLVQDFDGRTIPYHTLSDKLLRKIHQKDNFDGKNAVQTITALFLYGQSNCDEIDIVFVSSKIRGQLGVEKYISMKDMEDETGNFKWFDDYQIAYGKTDAQKNEYDKQLIKLGERYRILKGIFQFEYLRIVPLIDDQGGKWVSPFSSEIQEKDQQGGLWAFQLFSSLFEVSQGTGSIEKVQEFLGPLKESQWTELRKFEARNPLLNQLTQRHVQVEIAYNKVKIFDKIQSSYFFLGFILLILFFIRTLITPTIKRESIVKKISIPIIALVIVVFVMHGVGLGMRWYITGHAPWSDGYEAIIFISWATILSGMFFVRKNPAVIAVTVLLSAMMLFVTELNLMDPEITPLEPVLQSYWLMIHVAVITSSYGFLGVSAILGFLNMVLYLLKTEKNKKRLQMNIIELSAVSEMVMIIGLFLLSAGTFIGGVWANESWGRYWGWDPKEVWALVSMLVYATIIHLRWIPALSNRFLFNILSFWGYSSILFTFFGVNFILVGLHSYAQGDGVAEWPTGVIVSIIAFSIFTLLAIVKYKIDTKKSKPISA